ncbi:Xanthotoxin 5-hydroxylase CYP82C4 [Citrus sinensis]|nr:Xanthotoxin 5-hydroxylase CYP82C4 [Citrus sinensis]
MANKYGPIFTMKMGVNRALVVSNSEITKECFTTNDKALASRPRRMAMEILGYNFLATPSSPYGSYWRETRKIATVELLSNHRLEKLKHVRESEVTASIKGLFKDCQNSATGKVSVEMKHWLEGTTFDIIIRIIEGKRYTSQEGTDLHEHAASFFTLFGKFVVSDALPFLRWLDIGGNEKLMKKTAKEFDIILQQWLDEHKIKRGSSEVEGDEDFIYVMLSLLYDNAKQLPDSDADTVIKALCLAQDELNIHVGANRQVNESDIKNLVYLQAILKETMRLYPAAPLLLPHQSMEDCTISGYHVPAGTQLFVNAWKVHHDPKVWKEPCKFLPERFLTTHKDIDLRGQNFELIPFGSGRRICPGISFAFQVMPLILASLLHGFDLATPLDEPVDMEEAKSLTITRATPLKVLLTPRLSASLYD